MGNRVIKFRGKRVDSGEWVYGDLHHGQSAGNIYIMGIQVIPETVGQYTGLKDKNGTEIYEGDVIHNRSIITQWDKDLINEIQAVVLIRKGMTRVEGWNENGYIGEEINRVHYACLFLSPEIFEVIGNIHELGVQSDLLELADELEDCGICELEVCKTCE